MSTYKIYCLNTIGWSNGKYGPTYSHSQKIHQGWVDQQQGVCWPLSNAIIDREGVWQTN